MGTGSVENSHSNSSIAGESISVSEKLYAELASNYAKKEDVQREQKEARSFMIGKGSLLIGAMALLFTATVLIVAYGIGSRIESFERSTNVRIDATKDSINSRLDSQQRQLDTIITQLNRVESKMIGQYKSTP